MQTQLDSSDLLPISLSDLGKTGGNPAAQIGASRDEINSGLSARNELKQCCLFVLNVLI